MTLVTGTRGVKAEAVFCEIGLVFIWHFAVGASYTVSWFWSSNNEWVLTKSFRKEPYEEMDTIQVALSVLDGHRPVIPENAPASYARLMASCWHPDPEQRPVRTLSHL